mmetsp:Transcript_46975/g.133566  ORF Transcript_46975/g.133566 Transcript_46975/m.133566 type:complete len:219 (-) Transcript_46975:380-1036(-)
MPPTHTRGGRSFHLAGSSSLASSCRPRPAPHGARQHRRGGPGGGGAGGGGDAEGGAEQPEPEPCDEDTDPNAAEAVEPGAAVAGCCRQGNCRFGGTLLGAWDPGVTRSRPRQEGVGACGLRAQGRRHGPAAPCAGCASRGAAARRRRQEVLQGVCRGRLRERSEVGSGGGRSSGGARAGQQDDLSGLMQQERQPCPRRCQGGARVALSAMGGQVGGNG